MGWWSEALEWVKGRNKHAVDTVGDPAATGAFRRILDALNSKEKIPYATRQRVVRDKAPQCIKDIN